MTYRRRCKIERVKSLTVLNDRLTAVDHCQPSADNTLADTVAVGGCSRYFWFGCWDRGALWLTVKLRLLSYLTYLRYPLFLKLQLLNARPTSVSFDVDKARVMSEVIVSDDPNPAVKKTTWWRHNQTVATSSARLTVTVLVISRRWRWYRLLVPAYKVQTDLRKTV